MDSLKLQVEVLLPCAAPSILWFSSVVCLGKTGRTIVCWLQAIPIYQSKPCWWRSCPGARLPISASYSIAITTETGAGGTQKDNCQVSVACMAKPGNHELLKEGGMVQPLLVTESEPRARLSWATQHISAPLLSSLPAYKACMLYQVFSFPVVGIQPQTMMGLSSVVVDGLTGERHND